MVKNLAHLAELASADDLSTPGDEPVGVTEGLTDGIADSLNDLTKSIRETIKE